MIKTKTLKKDIERGVKHLSEHSYSNLYGATRSSIEFVEKAFTHDIGQPVKVIASHTRKHWYTVAIHTSKGYTVQVKGFSFGHYSEGSRGLFGTLEALGFTKDLAEKCYSKREDYTGFSITRKA